MITFNSKLCQRKFTARPIEDVTSIVDLMVSRVREQLKSKDLDLELTEDAKAWLAQRGYDASLGARPLRRTIQRDIEDRLSEKVLWGEFGAGQVIVADVEDDDVVFRALDQTPDTVPAELAGAGGGGENAET